MQLIFNFTLPSLPIAPPSSNLHFQSSPITMAEPPATATATATAIATASPPLANRSWADEAEEETDAPSSSGTETLSLSVDGLTIDENKKPPSKELDDPDDSNIQAVRLQNHPIVLFFFFLFLCVKLTVRVIVFRCRLPQGTHRTPLRRGSKTFPSQRLS